MHTDKVWLVILLVVLILVGSNALMFGMVRSMRGTKWHWIDHLRNISEPVEKEQKDLGELNRRVKALKQDQSDDD